MTFPNDLIDRFQHFKSGEFADISDRFARLAEEGQKPETMVISCCDSRVTPEAIFSALPGDLFVVRNVANLVPSFEQSGTYHGVSAALEFAVLNLLVRNIVVMGHARCGGVKACVVGGAPVESSERYIANWMEILAEPHKRVRQDNPGASDDELATLLELEGIKQSLKNLTTFSFIETRVGEGSLHLHGAFFDIATGDLQVLDPDNGKFAPPKFAAA